MSAPAGWRVRAAVGADAQALLALRLALWPDADDGVADDSVAELQAALAQSDAGHLLVVDDVDTALGFAEVSVRHEYVNGTESTPVGFLEGWYVIPAWRGRGSVVPWWRRRPRGRVIRAARSWLPMRGWKTAAPRRRMRRAASSQLNGWSASACSWPDQLTSGPFCRLRTVCSMSAHCTSIAASPQLLDHRCMTKGQDIV